MDDSHSWNRSMNLRDSELKEYIFYTHRSCVSSTLPTHSMTHTSLLTNHVDINDTSQWIMIVPSPSRVYSEKSSYQGLRESQGFSLRESHGQFFIYVTLWWPGIFTYFSTKGNVIVLTLTSGSLCLSVCDGQEYIFILDLLHMCTCISYLTILTSETSNPSHSLLFK